MVSIYVNRVRQLKDCEKSEENNWSLATFHILIWKKEFLKTDYNCSILAIDKDNDIKFSDLVLSWHGIQNEVMTKFSPFEFLPEYLLFSKIFNASFNEIKIRMKHFQKYLKNTVEVIMTMPWSRGWFSGLPLSFCATKTKIFVKVSSATT